MQVKTSNTMSLSTSEEDYLEAILISSHSLGYARSCDIAGYLNVAPSSVHNMVIKLDKKGLVHYQKYEGVTLTQYGKTIAEQIYSRHRIIVEFLEILGVPQKIADNDACFMEHKLNKVTIQKIKEFVNASQNNNKI